jgi:hypothetical protein
MRLWKGSLVGFLLLTLVAAIPVAAAPAIAIAPTTVPRGGTLTVTGAGFAPNAALGLFAVIDAFAGARVKLADLTAGADGGVMTTVRVPGQYPSNTFTLVITAAPDGADLAQATIALTDAPSIAPERLTVTPGTGPAGTRFAAIGTGLPAGSTVAFFTTESAKGPGGNFRAVATMPVPADGRVSVTIDSTGYGAESYDLIVFGPGGPAIGFPLVRGTFTVTAPGTASAPSAPRTGGGGEAAFIRRLGDG